MNRLSYPHVRATTLVAVRRSFLVPVVLSTGILAALLHRWIRTYDRNPPFTCPHTESLIFGEVDMHYRGDAGQASSHTSNFPRTLIFDSCFCYFRSHKQHLVAVQPTIAFAPASQALQCALSHQAILRLATWRRTHDWSSDDSYKATNEQPHHTCSLSFLDCLLSIYRSGTSSNPGTCKALTCVKVACLHARMSISIQTNSSFRGLAMLGAFQRILNDKKQISIRQQLRFRSEDIIRCEFEDNGVPAPQTVSPRNNSCCT